MAILTENYQYIGRSGAVSCKAGWNYYILLYAKTAPRTDTGTHTVSVRMRLACTADATFYGFGTAGSVTVGGVSAISWNGSAIPGSDWSKSGPLTEDGVYYYRYTDLATGSAVVDTGWGSAKDISVSVSWGRVESVEPVPAWLPYYKTYAAGTLTVTLPAILGASSISSAEAAVLGETCRIRWTPVASDLSYRLQFSLGDWSHTTDRIYPNTASGYTYTGYRLPMEAAWQLTDSKTGTMGVTLYTYSESGTQLGSGSSGSFPVTVPESTGPTLSITGVSPVSGLPAPFDGLFIKGKSRVRATAEASGQYGASIIGCRFSVEGKTYSSGGTSDYLTTAGTVIVRAEATDSRGYTRGTAVSISVLDYAAPTVAVSCCARADDSGALSDSGTRLRVTAAGSVASLGGRNSGQLWFQWKPATAPDSGFSQKTVLSGAAFDGLIPGLTFQKQTSYVVRIGVTDTLGETATAAFTVMTERICWHRGEDFLSLGMYAQNGGLECAWPARFYGQVYIGDETLQSYIQKLVTGG